MNNLDNEKCFMTRKTMEKPNTLILKDAVFTWYTQRRAF